MEMFIVLLTILIGILLLFIHHQMTYWSNKGVPHIKIIPIIGNRFVTLIFGGPSVPEFSMQIYNQFPEAKYVGLMMFNSPVILLKDLELIKDVCVKNFDFCPDHQSFIDERMDPILGKNVFSLRGERWREIRSALSPSFTTSKMKFLFQLILKVSDDFINYFDNHSDITNMIDVKDAFTRYTNDVIATSAFGISVDSMKNRENEFYLRGKDATNLTGTRRILKFMAGIIFPRLMRLAGQTYLSKDTNKFFVDLIHKTVKMRDEKGIVRPDMIHLLMQARDSAGFEMTIDDIVAQAFIFFLAGFDTSSTLMSFVCHQLAYHPDVQSRLCQEIDSLTSNNENNEPLSYDIITKMKYMDMVINETLRLYPPVVILDRVCVKSFDLPSPTPNTNGITVSPGSKFWIAAYAMHRDPKYFPNPDEFIPDRFNDENKDNILPYSFVPFGIGPRKCIGERFGMMETKLLLARILQKFIIKPTEKSTKDIIIDRSSLNLVPKGGIWLQFAKRN